MQSKIILFSFLLVSFPHLVLARSSYDDNYGSSGGFDVDHKLSTSAGIASPSSTSALFENPAGLTYNQETKFLGELAGTNSHFNPLGFGGIFYLGNGTVGGAIGVQTFNSQGDNANQITLLNFGLGAEVTSLNFSIGITGAYTLSSTGNPPGVVTNSGFSSNLGMIYNPRGDIRIGVTAFNILDNVDGLGAGIAADANAWATFGLDAAFNPKTSNGAVAKPSLQIHLSDFQLALGYGIPIDHSINNWIPYGSSFGVGIRCTYNIHLQAYYNQLALYYIGLSISL